MSTLRVNTIQDAAGSGSPAIAGAAKAWVNFNGTGTVAIRAALNVSSITDNGTGDYTVNFTNALADANYSVAGCAQFSSSSFGAQSMRVVSIASGSTPSVSSCRVGTTFQNGSVEDVERVAVNFFR